MLASSYKNFKLMKKNLIYYAICFFAICCIACKDENVPYDPTSPEISFTYFSFSKEDNPEAILKDINVEIGKNKSH